jgi:hypothetical protein
MLMAANHHSNIPPPPLNGPIMDNLSLADHLHHPVAMEDIFFHAAAAAAAE